jgi:ABC-type Fe3+-siderophore transport system permease subunit
MILPLATTSDPITILVDIFFLALFSSFVSWYFNFRLKKEIFGGFFGGAFFTALGSLIFMLAFQNSMRSIIMWLMSPKLGNIQLSNLNLIALLTGGFLTLYIIYLVQQKRKKE